MIYKAGSSLKRPYGGIILGGTGFVKEVLRRIKDESYRKEDIANRTELHASLKIEDVLEAVSNYYNVSRDDIMENKYSEERKVAIYLMKDWTGATHREIGEVFLGLTNSARGKACKIRRTSNSKSTQPRTPDPMKLERQIRKQTNTF